MANMREIQDRMKSIQDTMKITNAMYMISSSKMKRAQKILKDTEPYYFAMQDAIGRVLRHVPDIEHIYFESESGNREEKNKKIGYIVVTGDKGLAGAYNHNILKIAEEQMAKPGEHRLFVLGELGRHYFAKRMPMWIPLSAIRYRIPRCTEREASASVSSDCTVTASWMRFTSFLPR